MALIATASAIVTYAVFRSSTDPLVIVYADPDLTRPSLINLVIKNIGKGAAHAITFKPSRPLPNEAFGINVPAEMPKEMKAGPIVTGIPFLAPGQQIILTWGQYGGLYKYIGDTPIAIESLFHRIAKPRFFSRRLCSKSSLDIRTFERSESSEYGFGPNLVKQFEKTNETMTAISLTIKKLTEERKS